MKNARYGLFLDKKYLFTHYNPVTHEVWSDDIPVMTKGNGGVFEWGAWLPYDLIKWC